MEALIHDDSPLAAYLEGSWCLVELLACPVDVKAGQGENLDDERDASVIPSLPTTPANRSFAPQGLPRVRSRVRQKVPPPLKLEIPRPAVVGVIQETCSVRDPICDSAPQS